MFPWLGIPGGCGTKWFQEVFGGKERRRDESGVESGTTEESGDDTFGVGVVEIERDDFEELKVV